MKTGILLAILVCAVSAASAQKTLKEALYSGKLKLDTGTVIRKGDDISSRIDTSTKKPVVEAPRVNTAPMVLDSTGQLDTNPAVNASPATTTKTDPTATPGAPVVKDNNRVWKDYIDELTGALRTEVLSSKKIKSGAYSILIDYEIGIDGTITVNSVSSSPENSFLEQQVKERMTLGAPKLTPLLGTNGKPRKAPKKQIITLSKG
jgi:hypothetical protein